MKEDSKRTQTEVVDSSNVSITSHRIAFIKKGESAAVKPGWKAERGDEEQTVMSAPALLLRGIIVFEIIVIIVGLLSYAFNAPLEGIADPQHTPNPAKAPWYFLGLQELLHYFHPVIAGILIPLLLVIALVVIPYAEVNLTRKALWHDPHPRTFYWLSGVALGIAALTGWFHAWPIVIPTLFLYVLMILPYVSGKREGWIGWLARRALSDWIMAWFVMVVTILTVIGTFFRGPGWSWVWPWK